MRYRLIASLALLIMVADQLLKWGVTATLFLHEERIVTPYFSIVYVKNRGAAFGFLNDPSITWQFWFFTSATVVALGIMGYLAKKAQKHEKILFYAIGCITGGAIGNFIDRIRFRAVIDFLDFHVGPWHWPAFNLADISICVGAGLIGLLAWFPSLSQQRKEQDR